MRFINENKLLSFLILALLFTGGAFYWFEWRPNKIRTKCHNYSKSASESEASFNAYLQKSGLPPLNQDSFTKEGRSKIKEQFYRDCLRDEGLNE